MTDPFAQAAAAEQADRRHRRSRARRSALRVHVAVFVAVQLLLLAVWALGTREHPWFVYPLLGWGVGLVAHAVSVRSAAPAA